MKSCRTDPRNADDIHDFPRPANFSECGTEGRLQIFESERRSTKVDINDGCSDLEAAATVQGRKLASVPPVLVLLLAERRIQRIRPALADHAVHWEVPVNNEPDGSHA